MTGPMGPMGPKGPGPRGLGAYMALVGRSSYTFTKHPLNIFRSLDDCVHKENFPKPRKGGARNITNPKKITWYRHYWGQLLERWSC